MNNIFSYIKWRGDLSFEVNKFNEVDSLILCAFTYVKIDNYINKDEIISIEELYKKYQKNPIDKTIFNENNLKLFSKLSKSTRFKNIKVSKFINKVSNLKEEQFRAMTFILPNNTLYIAFSGTDETVVGWKEDFNLSFMDVIPSQRDALNYLIDIIYHTKKNVYIGGHSKGGNLALFSSIYLNNDLKNQIIKVNIYDGPGLSKKAFSNINFKIINNRIESFIPKSSIIGNIFINKTKTYIVESSNIGIFEHDLYSWNIDNNKIVCINKPDKKLCNNINSLIEKIPKEKRVEIINTIYEILEKSGITNVEDFLNQIFNLKKYNLEKEEIELVKNIIKLSLDLFKNLK